MGQATTVCLLTDRAVRTFVCEIGGREVQVAAHHATDHDLPDSLFQEHDREALAAAIAESVFELAAVGRRVTLIVPLQWCFTHVLTPELKKVTAQSLAFEFEQFLPVPLEGVTCAFAPIEDRRYVAVAIPTDPMHSLMEMLSGHGVYVEHIVVDVIALAIRENEKVDVAILDARWVRMCRRTVEGLAIQSTGRDDAATPGGKPLDDHSNDSVGRGSETPLMVLDLVGSSQQSIANEDLGALESGKSHIVSALTEIGKAVSIGPSVLDLRTGALAAPHRLAAVSRLAEHCLGMLIGLVFLVAAGLALHTQSIHANIAAIDEARLAVYRRAFDAEALPPGAAMRLASERIRLEGLTQGRGRSELSRSQTGLHAIEALRGVIERLPADVRIMLLEARLDDRQLNLRGQTVEHRDAERIAEAINAGSALLADPPRTTRLRSGGVEFSILATRKATDVE